MNLADPIALDPLGHRILRIRHFNNIKTIIPEARRIDKISSIFRAMHSHLESRLLVQVVVADKFHVLQQHFGSSAHEFPPYDRFLSNPFH